MVFRRTSNLHARRQLHRQKKVFLLGLKMDPNAVYEPASLAVTSSDDESNDDAKPNIVPILYSSLIKPELPSWPEEPHRSSHNHSHNHHHHQSSSSSQQKHRPRTPPSSTRRRSRSPAKRDNHNHRVYRPYPENPRHHHERRSEPLPPPAPREPRDDWETMYDRQRHRRYYVNRYLGTSTWVKPSGKVRPLDD